MKRNVSRDQLGPIAEQILEDYENYNLERSPFKKDHLPEKKVIDDLGNERDRTIFLTLTASIDYIKETEGERGVWQTSKRFWNDERWLFEPEIVAKEATVDDLAEMFGEVGWWRNQDATIWHTICTTLHHDFDDNPMNLFEKVDYDAVHLKKYINEHGSDFPFLKGPKISSLWLRLIHEEVHPLENIEDIPIPADTHIISITNTLLGTDYSHGVAEEENTVREIWSEVCRNHNLVPVRLDQPLWLIDKYWNQWGKDYLEGIVNEVTPQRDRD